MKIKSKKSQGRIRITGGELRGREILSPGRTGTHPMGARERLALFNMISGEIVGARVLDAHAGTGALGIEALSRGAAEMVFVEKNPGVAKVIWGNLGRIGVGNGVEVVVSGVGEFVREGAEGDFGVILADPPYDGFEVSEVAGLARILAPGGVLVLSHPGEAPEVRGLTLEKSRKYAGARISVYRRAR